MEEGGILRFLILICCAALFCAAIGMLVTADADGRELHAQSFKMLTVQGRAA